MRALNHRRGGWVGLRAAPCPPPVHHTPPLPPGPCSPYTPYSLNLTSIWRPRPLITGVITSSLPESKVNIYLPTSSLPSSPDLLLTPPTPARPDVPRPPPASLRPDEEARPPGTQGRPGLPPVRSRQTDRRGPAHLGREPRPVAPCRGEPDARPPVAPGARRRRALIGTARREGRARGGEGIPRQ